MSRYYDKDISMHSYDNGIGVKVKKDNWDQLYKLFSRIPDLEPLTVKEDIDAIIHCQNGAAVAFLTKLYQCLTKRTIQTTVVPLAVSALNAPSTKSKDTIDLIPPYAKPTGTALIREKMRAPEIAEVNDQQEMSKKVRNIQAQHEETLQLERLIDPDRYTSRSKTQILRGTTKPLQNEENLVLTTQNVVKEVQIKSLNEKMFAQLRATREAKESEYYLNGGSSPTGHGTGFRNLSLHDGRSGATGNAHVGDAGQRRRAIDLLNEHIGRKASSLIGLDPRKEKFEAFLDLVHSNSIIGENELASVLRDISGEAGIIASAILDFPKDFWKISGLLFPLLIDQESESAIYQAAQHVFLSLGHQCVQHDPSASSLLLTDFLLPRIALNLGLYATKRHDLLEIVYAFAGPTVLAHIQVIKRLREAIPDIPLFIHTLSILLYMETELDDTLVDLYHYYCCIGLENSCEKLRAACLSMLVPFLSYDVSLVIDLLPRLTQLCSRYTWWEVKAQLLIVASAVLYYLNHQQQQQQQPNEEVETNRIEAERDYTEQIELALTIVEKEFHPTANLNIRRVGLSYLSKNLAYYQEIVPLYVDVLMSLPSSLRHIVIGPPPIGSDRETQEDLGKEIQTCNVLPVQGTSGARYRLIPLVDEWDSVAIAKQIFYECKTQKEKADFDPLLVLHACFQQLAAKAPLEVQALYEQMRSYIVLGLVNTSTVDLTLGIFHHVLDVTGDAAFLFQNEQLVDTLQRLVTRNVEDTRQLAVVHFLHDVLASNKRMHSLAVKNLLQSLRRASDSNVFAASLFATITLEEIA
jgi:hypothetical protein